MVDGSFFHFSEDLFHCAAISIIFVLDKVNVVTTFMIFFFKNINKNKAQDLIFITPNH